MSAIWLKEDWDGDCAECPGCSNRNVRKATQAYDGERFVAGWAFRGQGYEGEDHVIVYCPFCGVKLP